MQTELSDVYKSYEFEKVDSVDQSREMRFIDAVSDSLEHAMKKHNDLVIMGQDIAEGVFMEEFLKFSNEIKSALKILLRRSF